MSVLKQKRTTSKAEFINTANQIYVETLNFLTRLSARYSRLIAEPVAKLAGEIIDHAEKANSIFPSDNQRIEMRKAHLLEARASLMALDVRLTHVYLKLMGHEIVRRFEAAGIRVNKRKCKVIPLTKPFRFCKARFTLTETGKIKVNGSRDGVKRARRKLKLFHREFKEGKRSFFDIEQYMECQSAYYRNFNDHGRLLRLRRLYHAIFFGGGQCLESSKPGPVSV